MSKEIAFCSVTSTKGVNLSLKPCTNIDKLYKTNLLEQNNKCILELTDKTNKILWSSPLPDIYPLPLQQAPLQTQPITATRSIVPVRR